MSTVTVVSQLDKEASGYTDLVKDANGDSSTPATNYGTSSSIEVGWVAAVTKTPAAKWHGMFRFDISKTVPTSATITAATLYLSVGSTTFDAGETFDIHRVKRYDWVENEMTWNSWKGPVGDGTWAAVAPFETNTISKVGADWTTNYWAGGTVRIVSGTGAGDEQVVLSNTADQLTIVGTWAVTPDATSTFNMNTWETAGAVGASDYDSTPAYANVQGPTSTSGWWSTDVTTLVQDARTIRNDIVNMMMKATTESGTDHYFTCLSSEASAGNI